MARTLKEIAASRPKVDRAKIEATTETDIARHDREDDERPGADAFVKRGPGQRGLGKKPAKVAISIRLEPDVPAAYKATGDGWQSIVTDTLRTHMPAKGMATKRKVSAA